ncbi:hypothetical protein [Salinirussus salinus]|uniref:hypothetical protein n=1 Tax=Salinirussus salinus TaxID=1198300 RepID=UPI001357E998|nr:hypothetical protein [Salinirussus salinus]
MPSSIRTSYASVADWLHEHAIVWWLILAVVPGATYGGAEMVLHDGSPTRAAVLGTAFGVTFATVSILVRRWRRG